jgi:ferredoxin
VKSQHQFHCLTGVCAVCGLQVAELKQTLPLHEQLLDTFLAAAHQSLTSMEGLRVIAGGSAVVAAGCFEVDSAV